MGRDIGTLNATHVSDLTVTLLQWMMPWIMPCDEAMRRGHALFYAEEISAQLVRVVSPLKVFIRVATSEYAPGWRARG